MKMVGMADAWKYLITKDPENLGEVEYRDIPAEAGFYATCYRHFINECLIKVSEKKLLKRNLWFICSGFEG